MTRAGRSLQLRYQELLRSPILDRDPYSRPNLHVYRPRHLKMAAAIERHLQGPRRAIADIGCHNGFFLRLSAELGFREFVAVDFFQLPAERSFLSGLEGTRFIKTNFNEEGFLSEIAPASLDCVVSTEVFEHVYHHPLGYLQECWRALRSGGLLLLTTPNPCTLANAVRLAAGRPINWGDQAFARTPKSSGSAPIAVWDIHFREYVHSDLVQIVSDLPEARILEAGFLANSASPEEPLLKRTAKRLLWKTGLGHWRPVAATQYLVLKKGADS